MRESSHWKKKSYSSPQIFSKWCLAQRFSMENFWKNPIWWGFWSPRGRGWTLTFSTGHLYCFIQKNMWIHREWNPHPKMTAKKVSHGFHSCGIHSYYYYYCCWYLMVSPPLAGLIPVKEPHFHRDPQFLVYSTDVFSLV